MQVPSRQSALTEQVLLFGQGEQEPPQSKSVSVPFLLPSLQEGRQLPEMHLPLMQSTLTTQASVSAHFGQKPPPQSLSVSVPSLIAL